MIHGNGMAGIPPADYGLPGGIFAAFLVISIRHGDSGCPPAFGRDPA